MPLENDEDAAHLWDMLQLALKVRAFVDGKTFDQYLADELLQAAVERKIEIIGEAARRVSPSLKREHSEISWRPIMAQRCFLAHEYGEINQERLRRVAKNHIPKLIIRLSSLIPKT